jgi:hypothetical protein
MLGAASAPLSSISQFTSMGGSMGGGSMAGATGGSTAAVPASLAGEDKPAVEDAAVNQTGEELT